MQRILIVEDERIVARDISQQLTELGYGTAGIATRGDQAISMAGELRPDLVLMDIQLAGKMDGIEAAQAIHDRFGLPVVFLTAFATDEVLARAKRTGPFGYVLKPFTERELRTVLEMALYKHAAESRTARGSGPGAGSHQDQPAGTHGRAGSDDGHTGRRESEHCGWRPAPGAPVGAGAAPLDAGRPGPGGGLTLVGHRGVHAGRLRSAGARR
jgi:CheY-like chemotaxis protein